MLLRRPDLTIRPPTGNLRQTDRPFAWPAVPGNPTIMAGDHNGNSIEVGNPSPALKHPLRDSHHRSRSDVIKRRSSRACCSCRARKVRCDITVHGRPCTNCRLDCVDCVLLVSRRGPKPRKKVEAPPQDTSTDTSANTGTNADGDGNGNGNVNRDSNGDATVDDACLPQQIWQEDQWKDPQLQSHPEPSFEHHQQQEVDDQEEHEHAVGPMTPASSSRDLDTAAITENELMPASPSASRVPAGKIYEVAVGLTFDNDSERNNDAHTIDSSDGVGQHTPSLHTTAYGYAGSRLGSASSAVSGLSLINSTLPPFICPLPKTIAEDDLEFLERKGAFVMPEAELRDEILRSYVSTLHPFMPILDIRAFLTAVANNSTGGQISLLLFQAVMFAGLAALDPQLIQCMGFTNTKHARRVFFARVRLLHDLDIEPGGKPLLQSLLLMSLWDGGRNEVRSTWYYTGLALSLAQNMGLHREPEESHPDHSLRRRLWWSLYIRDRLIALGTRRPMRIRDDDYEVSMLSQRDFDCEPLDELLSPFFNGGSSVEDTDHKTYLPLMCIELAKLCVCIGHVLTSQYTTFGRRSLWTKELMVVPKQDLERPAEASEIEQYDREIADWYKSLHPDVAIVARRLANEWSSCSPTEWHWTVVDMLRLTLVGLLHRPQGFRPFPTSGADDNTHSKDLIQASRTKLKAAARELTSLTYKMLKYDQIRYLPTSGVSMLLSASLTHILELEAQDDDIRDASIYRFDQIMRALKQLREIYGSADSAMNYLGMVIRKTGISARVSQVAAIAPEFRCTMPGGGAAETAIETRHDGHGGTALKTTTSAFPYPDRRHQPDEDMTVSSFPLPHTMISTTDTYIPQHAPLVLDQDGQNTNVQLYTNPELAKTPKQAEFGMIAMSEAQYFGASSLAGQDTITVETQGGEEDGRLDDMLTNGALFSPLRSLNYDVDPELFNAQFSFYDNDFSWLENGGG